MCVKVVLTSQCIMVQFYLRKYCFIELDEFKICVQL